MINNIHEITEYPYSGVFTRDVINNPSAPLVQQTHRTETVLTTVCDIQENSHSYGSDFISASFSVYFPSSDVEVKNGDIFSGSINGLDVNGKVIGVFPSQLGGCRVYIKDNDI